MPNHPQASKFIEEAVNHPEWLKAIEAGPAEAVVKLANDHGFGVSLADLKGAANDLLVSNHPAGAAAASLEEIDEAASGMTDFQNDTGYGDDTGYAALYGVAGTILKL